MEWSASAYIGKIPSGYNVKVGGVHVYAYFTQDSVEIHATGVTKAQAIAALKNVKNPDEVIEALIPIMEAPDFGLPKMVRKVNGNTALLKTDSETVIYVRGTHGVWQWCASRSIQGLLTVVRSWGEDLSDSDEDMSSDDDDQGAVTASKRPREEDDRGAATAVKRLKF
jgi:hypothetical protein